MVEVWKGNRGYLSEEARRLVKQRDAVPNIVGTPVWIAGDALIIMDYDKVKAALRLTKGMARTITTGCNGLTIRYDSAKIRGEMVIHQLPEAYKLLEGLPIIGLEEGAAGFDVRDSGKEFQPTEK
jgi:hypothetical protein